jgi:hypothetical protein
MDKFLMGLLIALGTIALVAFIALISGTILYWIWPVAIPAVFPGLVTAGTLAAKLAWWQAVCLTWICGILIKSTQTNNNKNE